MHRMDPKMQRYENMRTLAAMRKTIELSLQKEEQDEEGNRVFTLDKGKRRADHEGDHIAVARNHPAARYPQHAQGGLGQKVSLSAPHNTRASVYSTV